MDYTNLDSVAVTLRGLPRLFSEGDRVAFALGASPSKVLRNASIALARTRRVFNSIDNVFCNE